jgi:hypothetical protein
LLSDFPSHKAYISHNTHHFDKNKANSYIT